MIFVLIYFVNLTILPLICKYAISAELLILDSDGYYGLEKDRHFGNTRGQPDVGFRACICKAGL